jgi:tetratricopeptide (TPR) repeat protein
MAICKESEMKRLVQVFVILLCGGVWFGQAAYAVPSVVVSEGKYVMGDLDSKKDAKALALIEAKRLALEQAGTYIASSTEVKNFQLSKDQINTLASGIMSVEVLKEDWKMSGENMVVTIQIRATIDTSNLKDKISRMQEDESTENYKEIQSQLAALKKELSELKAERQKETAAGAKEPPTKELKEKHEDIVKRMSALEYVEKGNGALASQRWQAALDAFNQVIAINAGMVDAYAGKSFALYMLRKPEEAIVSVDKGLEIDPLSPRNLGVKALILKDRPDQVDVALGLVNKALHIAPGSQRLYRIRGEVYIKMKRPRLAQADFLTACKLGAKEACRRAELLRDKVGPKGQFERR